MAHTHRARARRRADRRLAGGAAPALASLLLSAALLGACTAAPSWRGAAPVQSAWSTPPRIVDAGRHLECVPYARAVSGVRIHGDAWTWWDQAAGRYRRGSTPRPGAVLAYKRKGASLGHLAVVVRVLDRRTAIVSHANWLNRGRIHENTPVRDVSARGDWSAVRTWYIPGNHWGGGTYATHGFIYPEPLRTARR